MAKETTKAALLDRGARLVHAQGFNNTGIQEILSAARVPKGSFYFYFRNKEDFGLQLIDQHVALLLSIGGAALLDETRPPLERLEAFFGAFEGHFEAEGCSLGCPIGNLAQEMSDLSEPFRTKLETVIAQLKLPIIACLDQARAQGELTTPLSSPELADFAINSWEGALIAMKVEKSTRPIDTFTKVLFGSVLK